MRPESARFSLVIAAAALASLARSVNASYARRNPVFRSESLLHPEANASQRAGVAGGSRSAPTVVHTPNKQANANTSKRAGVARPRFAPAVVHPPNNTVFSTLSALVQHPIIAASSGRGLQRVAWLQEWGRRHIQGIRTKSTGTSILIVVLVVIGLVMGFLLWQNNWNVRETATNTGRQMRGAVHDTAASIERRTRDGGGRFESQRWDQPNSSMMMTPQQTLLPSSSNSAPSYSQNRMVRKGGCC